MQKLHFQGKPLLLEPVPIQHLAKPLKRSYNACCRGETRLSESILPKMTYAHADTNVLLTIQHTLYQPKGGRKEKASITFFFPHQLFAA
jgi:hypothetical protein